MAATVEVRSGDGCFLAIADDGSMFVALERPARCGLCGVMHCWFVNREGRTRCFACDAEQRREEGT